MAKTTEGGVVQVHFLLLRINDPAEKRIANFIRACVPRRENYEWDDYFRDGKPNEYTSDHTFVNVLFVYEIAVKYRGLVEKRGQVFTRAPIQNSYGWYSRMLTAAEGNFTQVAKWIEKLVQQRARHLKRTALGQAQPVKAGTQGADDKGAKAGGDKEGELGAGTGRDRDADQGEEADDGEANENDWQLDEDVATITAELDRYSLYDSIIESCKHL
ncbi:hypothetical protein GN244_ATG18734 [Phytophthora infestans]|uniref:Uncharacterized protein n=1 Tax=Phytophthora infestans TaxID=4787 RepID=A0A833RP77_PHYIN|nr:hypothetical protein GN244_ATG18734 [Phytophthora infestans]